MADSVMLLERCFEATGADGTRTEVWLRIGQPRLDAEFPPAGSWICTLSNLGLGEDWDAPVPGVDSLDALNTALLVAEPLLRLRARQHSVTLSWRGGADLFVCKSAPSAEPRTDGFTGFQTRFDAFFANFPARGEVSASSDEATS